jgi:hypothetical protein
MAYKEKKIARKGKSFQEIAMMEMKVEVCQDCPDNDKCWSNGLEIYCPVYNERK